MHLRELFKILAVLAIIAGYSPYCFAATTQARVSSGHLSDHVHIVFDWDSQPKVPFTVDTRDNKILLHFQEPVEFEWGNSIAHLYPYVKQVDVKKNGKDVTILLNYPSQARRFLSYGRNGIDLRKSGIDITRIKNSPPVAILSTVKAHRNSLQAKVPKREIAQLAALTPSAGKPEPESTTTEAPKPSVAATTTAATPVKEVSTKEILTLPIKDNEPFAVFIRKKTLWIITSSTTPLSPEILHKTDSHFTQTAQKLSNAHASIYYMALSGDPFVSVEKSSQEGIQILLQNTLGKLSEFLAPELHTNAAKQTFMTIPAGKGDQLISFHDPLTNDDLWVIPLPGTGTGFSATHSFAEFSLLQSAQGIVVQKIADGLSIALQKGGVEISSPKGLTLSPEVSQQVEDMESEAAANRGPATLLPYVRWKLDDEKNIISTELKLFHDIAYSKMEEANKARLKLLGIYLSEGLFPEARGMADDILRVSLKFYTDNKIAALRGAAYFFMYRITDAERDFSSPELANIPEAKVWLNLCKELLGEPSESFNFLANYDRYIRHYPPVFIQKLAIIAADHNINRKEYDTALSIFDALKKDTLDEPVKKYIDYMHAKVLSETNNEEEAAKIWEQQASNVGDSLIRARAEFSLINMLLRQEKISHADAIKRLEKIRIVWRGDSLELNVLTLLGNLYVEEKLYSKALRALRDIVLYYPEVPEAVPTAKLMEETFVALYNKGGADSMPPLEALSLFYEFRDLVPIGKEGDFMVRNLADRLVNIDLLDRAALLLDHQIKKRLQGDERSRIGARLALIYLLNHQPKEALETLKTTGYGDSPGDLKLTRLRLTAQALAQQGQVDKAIDVLSSDNSTDGTVLRLSIYWDNKDWPNVVSTAEEILSNRNDPSAPLNPEESGVLLKLATAYVYEHDSGQIQYLRDYFTPLLKNNANKDSFLFITSESGSIDYENLANLDQDINTVKSFLDAYREKVKKNGLSNTIN